MSAGSETLLTVKELQVRLRISLATAYELVKKGKIRSVRVGINGGAIRIREADVALFLAASTHHPAGAPHLSKPVRVSLKHIKLK